MALLRIALCLAALVPVAAPGWAAEPAAQPGRSSRTPGSFVVSVQPDDQGRSLLQAIAGAQHAIDIVVYEINDPTLNAALAAAVLRGVNVRILLNGQWLEAAKLAQPLTMARQVRDAIEAPPGTPGAGRVDLRWASNNFLITHQKTVLIDAHRGDGVVAATLPRGAHAHVLTGNLQAYQYSTARVEGAAPVCPAPCAFWAARDFYVRVAEPRLVREIARVFDSDARCAGKAVTNGLRTTRLPLTWSNGSTGIVPTQAGTYPSCGLYPLFPRAVLAPVPEPVPDPGPGTDQGNVRTRTLALIGSARQRLDIYNEEMDDAQIESALKAAARRLAQARPRGQVRLVMTENPGWCDAFDRLVQAGVAVRVFPNGSGHLYIHAKVVMADARSAYIGSTNFSGASMNFNRELGLLLEGRPEVLAPVAKTFEQDFGDATAWQVGACSIRPSSARDVPVRRATRATSSNPLASPWACGPIEGPTCTPVQ